MIDLIIKVSRIGYKNMKKRSIYVPFIEFYDKKRH